MTSTVIYNWTPQVNPANGQVRLSGQVIAHPKIEDGTVVTTSVVDHCFERGNYLVVRTTSGTEYRLSYVNSDYGRKHKDVRKRFVDKFIRIEEIT